LTVSKCLLILGSVTEPQVSPQRMAACDRRTQLLEIALNLFAKKGFNGTTTKEIAAATGVTEAVIFRHFPHKQALYQAVLDSQIGCADFREAMAEVQASID